MGNEKSQPSGLIIEDKAFLSGNFWTLHSASYGSELAKKVTVFQGTVDNKNKPSALEKFSKNLMIHRHPNILRFVTSWKVSDQFHLVTEEVQTLQQVLPQQTPLQICIGLHCVLNALHFLHENALSSHNNVCLAAIYVTPEGYWKLGGMEYLCRFSDLSARFLAESREGRYDRAIVPGEEKRVPQPPSTIDRYAFCILVTEVLGKHVEDDVPGLLDFTKMCREFLDSTDFHGRYSLNSFLQHKFFNHEFISIHNFLTELALKTESERQIFFRELCVKLSGFNENIVASQLGSLLLSRIVLLDSTAQQCFLPHLLTPRSDNAKDCLFSEKTFRRHIAPKLLSIFYVRDIQVRLTLLKYFRAYCSIFTTPELHSHVLPELLVGVKDTNNELVAATLKALADLVPILGAAKVIGGKRAKHFSDGRPKAIRQTKGIMKKNKSVKIVEPETVTEEGEIFLSERPSPDGGEAPTLESNLTEDEVEPWDTWDSTPAQTIPELNDIETKEEMEEEVEAPDDESKEDVKTSTPVKVVPPSDSLHVYEVKAQVIRKPSVEEVDFFRDMEPVISKTSVLEIAYNPQKDEGTAEQGSGSSKSKFDISTEAEPEGWGDELEWADVNEE